MKMKSGEFIALSAASMMLTALGIDIMLPVFADVRVYFGLDPSSTAAAQIVSFFFLGQVTQVVFGILSDRHGRLRILRTGFPLYIAGGVAATFATSLGLMYAARFVAGMGAAAVMTTTIAGVRDRYVGSQMARIMSLIFTIFLFTPILAPFLGIGILAISSWRMVFLAPPIFAVLVFAWSFRLEESLPADQRSSPGWGSLFANFKQVLVNRIFLRFTTVTILLFSGLSAYVSSSEYIVGEIYGQPRLFVWIFAAIGFFMAICTLTNSRLSTRFGARQSIQWLLLFYTAIASLLLTVTLVKGDPPGIGIFFIAIALLMGINIAIEPNSSALALEPMGKIAGLAAALYGSAFFFIGGGLGSLISQLMKNRVMPLVLSFFLIGMFNLLLVYADKQKR